MQRSASSLSSRQMRTLKSLLVGVATTGGLGAVVLKPSPAFASYPACPWGPNVYAGSIETDGSNFFGESGNIQTYSVPTWDSNYNFIDQAYHVDAPNNQGLEVGWYQGWGKQVDLYVTDPHAYATLNGPSEQDGIDVGTNSNDSYATWWSGATDYYSVRNASGSQIWGGSIGTGGYQGGGQAIGVGEARFSGDAMAGSFTNEQILAVGGGQSDWKNWVNQSYCNDSPFITAPLSGTGFKDYGNT